MWCRRQLRQLLHRHDPHRIIGLLEEDDRFRNLVVDVRMLEPWLWRVTYDRAHLSWAILARRSMAASPE
jgi:hypothetical protein